jgi:hypothetical protein
MLTSKPKHEHLKVYRHNPDDPRNEEISKVDPRYEEIRVILNRMGKPAPYGRLIAAARHYAAKNALATAQDCVRSVMPAEESR